MAAEQIPGGRVCCCGCGASIEHLAKHAQYTPACRIRERNHRRRYRSKSPSMVETAIVRSAPGDTPSRKQSPCKVCAGMPWAREPDRSTLDDGSDCVVNDNGLCRGCGEPYAPEHVTRTVSLLSSSAGTAVRASDMHGQAISSGRGLYSRGTRNRPSRAKFG